MEGIFRLMMTGLIATSMLLSQDLLAQESEYVFAKAEVTIDGASSLHDWKVEASEVTGYPEQINFIPNTEGTIANFGFEVSVASMDGGRGSAMNNKIYKALKSDKHPLISYLQDGEAMYDVNGYLNSSGNLDIAGVTKEISIDVSTVIANDVITFSASYPMKLSDFDIEPPSAMFGQIVTKDDIVVNFQFVYKKQ